MIRTLQKKFVFAAMLAVTILLVGLLGSLNTLNAIFSNQQTEELLRVLVNSETMHSPQKAPPADEPKDKGDLFRRPMNENTKMSAVYFSARVDPEGTVVRTDIGRIATVSEEEAASMTMSAISRGKTSGRMGSFRYSSAETSDGRGTVWVFLNVSDQLHTSWRLLLVSALVGVACWLTMLLLICILSGRAIRPIAANLERQKQFVTDAGHEIKTPLAIIMANTEAMELHGGETKWSRNIRDQVTRLSGLMQNLLTLSKIDESNIAQTKEELDFSDLVRSETETFCEAMEMRGLRLREQIQPQVHIHANKELMRRLISILLDNAVKYAPVDGSITLEVLRTDKSTQLIVANDCENMPNCPPEKLFDRFYRADLARTQANGGYGIGLSAARSIVEAHGGSIQAAYPDDHTVAFFVTI